jgi:hypothetical protein
MYIDKETRTVHVSRQEFLDMQTRVQYAEINNHDTTSAALCRGFGEMISYYGPGELIVKVCEPDQERWVVAGWKPRVNKR